MNWIAVKVRELEEWLKKELTSSKEQADALEKRVAALENNTKGNSK